MASKGGCKVNTPDWSKAPNGCTHYGPDTDDWGNAWYMLVGGEFLHWWQDSWEKEPWMDAERISQLIPRPVQWRGPQDGLPPVGTEVEIRSGKEWYKAKVIAHGTERNAHIAILQADDWIAVRGSDAEGVRPIQSDRDRAIEEMHKIAVDACGHEAGLIPRINIARALYDAGYRKT